MLYIKNAKVVLETGIIWDSVIVLDKDRIAALGKAKNLEIPEGAKVLDANGLYVGPGFVDIHVHGGNGYYFEKDPEDAAEFFLRNGTTTIVPTLYFDLSKQGFLDAIETIRRAKENSKYGKIIEGLYMEGPYMNPKYGAMADLNKWKGDICPAQYEDVVDAAGDFVKVWAIAPEREGIVPFLQYAKKKNPQVVFSVGHSEATPEQIAELKHYGIKLQTHCANATGQTGGKGGIRGVGPDEYCFADHDMYAEVICDSLGIHVKPSMLRAILKIKGVDRTILITDHCISEDPVPEQYSHIEDLVFDHNGGLNGSKLTMNMACRNMMEHTDCGITQAFLLAARNPARILGLEHEIGTIQVGKKANLVFVDDMFHVKKVIFEGNIV